MCVFLFIINISHSFYFSKINCLFALAPLQPILITIILIAVIHFALNENDGSPKKRKQQKKNNRNNCSLLRIFAALIFGHLSLNILLSFTYGSHQFIWSNGYTHCSLHMLFASAIFICISENK